MSTQNNLEWNNKDWMLKMYCHPMLAWEDVTCHLFVSHLSPFRFEAMSHSGEIIFMAMGAEEEYQWRRQGRQSLRLLSTETFCWTYTVTFHWWFSGFNWSFSYFLSNWLVQSWGGDVFPNCLRLGTRHHGRCPQHQIPGLCSSVFGCDLPLSSHFLSWAELTWTDLNWIGKFWFELQRIELKNLSAESGSFLIP